jgi:hypothetical protein
MNTTADVHFMPNSAFCSQVRQFHVKTPYFLEKRERPRVTHIINVDFGNNHPWSEIHKAMKIIIWKLPINLLSSILQPSFEVQHREKKNLRM